MAFRPSGLGILAILTGGPASPVVAGSLMNCTGRCDMLHIWNATKRNACKAACAHGAKAGGGSAYVGGSRPYASPSSVGAAMATSAGPVVPLDPNAVAPGPGSTGTMPGSFLSSVPWWAWLAAAGVGGYLLLRRSA